MACQGQPSGHMNVHNYQSALAMWRAVSWMPLAQPVRERINMRWEHWAKSNTDTPYLDMRHAAKYGEDKCHCMSWLRNHEHRLRQARY